jgi:hypothetical protein
MEHFMINKLILEKVAKMLALFTLGILAPMQAYGDTDIALTQPYSIPNGVNGNEQTYDKQTFQALTTYDELKAKLIKIKHSAKKNKIDVGPLIRNDINNGLIDIDTPLDLSLPIKTDVCGNENLDPTVREAVVCTVNDGGRGNTDEYKIGLSTQGRELWGARLGNENGTKVLIITQQHGNEVQSTEAALKVIQNMALSKNHRMLDMLDKLNILFIVRANPDGGEPSPECFIGTPLGIVIQEDCAMTRTNVDPQAGGAYEDDSEEGFFGTVGVGYNLNRYHYVDLMMPIRPVETQAMVSVGLAWRPEVVLDLHGDIGKTSCEIDFSTIKPIPGILLPSAQCIAGSDQAPVVLSPFEFTDDEEDGENKIQRSRTLASRIAQRVETSGFGTVNRFAQLSTGAGVFNEGTIEAYEKIDALASGWESLNFLNAVSMSVQSIQGGVPQLGLTPEWFLGNKLNGANSHMNQIAIEEALEVISEWAMAEPLDEAGYCDIPLTTAVKAALPEEIFEPILSPPVYPGYGPYLVPLIGPLLQVFDSCPNNP